MNWKTGYLVAAVVDMGLEMLMQTVSTCQPDGIRKFLQKHIGRLTELAIALFVVARQPQHIEYHLNLTIEECVLLQHRAQGQ